MTRDQETVLLIKGAIHDLSETDRQAVMAQYNKIRALMAEEPLTTFAIALIGAELAV